MMHLCMFMYVIKYSESQVMIAFFLLFLGTRLPLSHIIVNDDVAEDHYQFITVFKKEVVLFFFFIHAHYRVTFPFKSY